MPRDLPASIETATRPCETFRFATLWQITRTDGEVLRFTDHNCDIVYSSNTYKTAGGYNASAVEEKSGTGTPSNLEITGVLTDDSITESDLLAGKYRDAEVVETLIDWRYPYFEPLDVHIYWIEDVKYSSNFWQAGLAGLGRYLAANYGKLYHHKCKYKLGDASCQVNLVPLTVSGTVNIIDTQRRKFQGTGHSAFTNHYFRYGLLTWTSGANEGLSFEIKGYTSATKQFTLFLPTPFDIAASDGYSVYAGCDKEATTCKDKFSNLVNHGGFPDLPGMDKAYKTPDVKS